MELRGKMLIKIYKIQGIIVHKDAKSTIIGREFITTYRDTGVQNDF